MQKLTPDTTPEVGCYVDGHWGWKAAAHMVEQFDGVHYLLDDRELEVVAEYVADERPEGLDIDTWVALQLELHEQVTELADECEAVINDGLPADRVAHWHAGEFFISPVCENGDCEDETCSHWCWS